MKGSRTLRYGSRPISRFNPNVPKRPPTQFRPQDNDVDRHGRITPVLMEGHMVVVTKEGHPYVYKTGSVIDVSKNGRLVIQIHKGTMQQIHVYRRDVCRIDVLVP